MVRARFDGDDGQSRRDNKVTSLPGDRVFPPSFPLSLSRCCMSYTRRDIRGPTVFPNTTSYTVAAHRRRKRWNLTLCRGRGLTVSMFRARSSKRAFLCWPSGPHKTRASMCNFSLTGRLSYVYSLTKLRLCRDSSHSSSSFRDTPKSSGLNYARQKFSYRAPALPFD